MDRFYTCEEIAEIYGVKITTVWAWIREGKLKAMKLGKNYRISKEALPEFENKMMTKEAT